MPDLNPDHPADHDATFDEAVRGRRALLVASTGGHLTQLARLRPTLDLAEGTRWVTFDNPQARSLLAGETVTWIPYIAPRDLKGALRSAAPARRLVRELRPEVVLSTGAAVAVPYLWAAASLRTPAVYLESVSRVESFSLTGRILARTPRVRTYGQHHALTGGRWGRGPRVLAAYTATELDQPLPTAPHVFVTLGTIRPYRFDRVVDRLLAIAQPDWRFTWQLGVTTRTDLPGEVHDEIAADEVDRLVRTSDVTVTHAGVGSALRIMDLGRSAVVVPREPAHDEHVDAHQEQIATFLDDRGLAVLARADALTVDDLARAHRISVRPA